MRQRESTCEALNQNLGPGSALIASIAGSRQQGRQKELKGEALM